jgi:hypothetical protein
MRNDSIMRKTIQALQTSGGMSNEEKGILDRYAFKMTKDLVESNEDRKLFCRNAVSTTSTMAH